MPRSTHSRQQLVERALVEERVAVGEQEDVHVGLAGEPREHRRLVHAGADRPDHALGAEPLEGRPRPVDRGLPVVVRVVDERDVDPVEAEPLEALLERAADAVGGVVEDESDGPGADVERVVAAVEALAVDVGVVGGSRLVADEPADLGRQDERRRGADRAGPRRPVAPRRRSRRAAPCRRSGCRGPRHGGPWRARRRR